MPTAIVKPWVRELKKWVNIVGLSPELPMSGKHSQYSRFGQSNHQNKMALRDGVEPSTAPLTVGCSAY